MEIKDKSLKAHYEWNGKIEVVATAPLKCDEDMSLAYTPGVAEACLVIKDDVDKSYELTRRNNLVAVITDGTAVLGLGDIGPEAGMPVMEGKCALFKTFADVDAFPLCVKTKDVDEIVETVYNISGSFGGINLEDIAAPRCFEIEKRLKEKCDIPIFHDDQHGTAVVTVAALINALKLVKKDVADIKVVISGAGAAGMAIVRLLFKIGVQNITVCDSRGIVCGTKKGLPDEHNELMLLTNKERKTGSLADAMRGADVFIGVSAPGIVTGEMVKSMAEDAIVMPMANPTPEVMPDIALANGAKVVGTGRSDFPNQINNVLAFPGIFRGALDVRASDINGEMCIAASFAIASLVSDDELTPEYILPKAFDERVGKKVSEAVAEAARKTNVARI